METITRLNRIGNTITAIWNNAELVLGRQVAAPVRLQADRAIWDVIYSQFETQCTGPVIDTLLQAIRKDANETH